MERRTFCKTASVALAAGALTQVTSAQDAPRPSNRGKIFKAVKLGRNTNRDHLKKLKDLGFDGVEPLAPGFQDLNGLSQMTQELGLKVHGVVDAVHWKQRLSSPDEAVRESGRKGLEQAIRDASSIGASSALLVPGRVTGEMETEKHVWDRSIAEIRKVLPLASRLGIRVLIETVWNGFCESPESFRDYLDEIDSPWVGAYYDIGNMQKFRASHEWITVLGSRIVKLDVKDWGVKNGFCPLGQGDVDWAAVRRELDKINFSGWATREGSDGGVDKTAALMNELLEL